MRGDEQMAFLVTLLGEIILDMRSFLTIQVAAILAIGFGTTHPSPLPKAT